MKLKELMYDEEFRKAKKNEKLFGQPNKDIIDDIIGTHYMDLEIEDYLKFRIIEEISRLRELIGEIAIENHPWP